MLFASGKKVKTSNLLHYSSPGSWSVNSKLKILKPLEWINWNLPIAYPCWIVFILLMTFHDGFCPFVLLCCSELPSSEFLSFLCVPPLYSAITCLCHAITSSKLHPSSSSNRVLSAGYMTWRFIATFFSRQPKSYWTSCPNFDGDSSFWLSA